MGIFDRMFGSKVSDKDTTDTNKQQEFEQLRNKYQPVLSVIQQQGVQLSNLHTENGKLVIVGTAPTQDAANKVWDQMKLFPNYQQELLADIKVTQTTPQVNVAAASAQGTTTTMNTYTVKAGDTLSKIANQFYGSSHEYMKIFNANQDKLSDPDKIFPGQVLNIPQ
jgi:nucleoid-associated protein YgaU